MTAWLTSELLADLCVPVDPHISPVGRWVVFAVGSASRRDEHDVSALWLACVGGETPARQLTAGFTNDTAPRWSPDGTRIVFLADRKQRGTQQVHILPFDGGEARQLTDEPGGVRDVQWLNCDPPRVAYLAADARPEDVEQQRTAERDDANVYGEFWGFSRLRLCDLEGDEARAVDFGERHVYSITPAPDGNQIAAVLWDTPELDGWITPSTLVIVDVVSASSRCTIELPFHPGSIVWNHAADTLYFTALGGATGVSSDQLWSIKVEDAARPVLLTDGFEYCIADIARGRGSEDIILNVMAGAESKLYSFSPSTARLRELQHFTGDIGALSVADDGGTVAVLASTAARPDDIYAGTLSEPLTRVSDLHAVLNGIQFGTQMTINWNRAGLELDGVLIYPPGPRDADVPLPTIVAIHGGPYGRWPNEFIGSFGRWIAQHGYLVFLPNARGGAGHGQSFAESVLHSVGNEDYLDIMAGVDMLVEWGLADPEQLGCGGWSQGGFMTAWIVGHTARFKAGVMGAGVSDWGMMIATSDIPSYENLMGGGDPYSGVGPHSFDAQSPISFVHQAQTPVLILHGEDDARVPLSQATFFHRGLRRYGVPTELVTYPREGHGIRERNHQIDLTRRIIDWYQRWIPVEERR